ncbi:MAG: hypothetical protein ACRELY_12185 [Polyangiaceae bacterium]
MNVRRVAFVPVLLFVAHCSSTPDESASSSSDSDLKNCHGKAASTIPDDGAYELTSFGGPGESGIVSCGDYTKNGTWYYAASRQRYGCGAHIQIEANGKCVVAQTDDYGPDVCVESAAGKPIIDASPLVSKYLFGASSAGWSDHLAITVTEVDKSTPLGPCTAAADPGADPDDSAGDSQ